MLSSSPAGVCNAPAKRPTPATRHPNVPRAPSARPATPISALFVAPDSVNPVRTSFAPAAASGSCSEITLMTPPKASEPYSTLAGPRITSIRRTKPVSTDGPSSSLHE